MLLSFLEISCEIKEMCNKNLCLPGPPASVPVSLVMAKCLSLCRYTVPTARPATLTTQPSRSRLHQAQPWTPWRRLVKEATEQRRSQIHLQQQQWLRNSPVPLRQATRRATSTGRHPRPSSEPHPLTSWVAPHHHRLWGATIVSTGTLSRPRPLLSRPFNAPMELLRLFPLLCTDPGLCTLTESPDQALPLQSQQLGTSIRSSTPTSSTREQNWAGRAAEDLLRFISALGQRRSTAGALHR